MFLFALRFNERGCHSTSSLEYVNSSWLNLNSFRNTFMLVSPKNKMKKAWNDIVLNRVLSWNSKMIAFISVLMKHENIQIVLSCWFKFNFLLLKSYIKSLIFQMANSIQGNLCFPFLELDWTYFNHFYWLYLSKVI